MSVDPKLIQDILAAQKYLSEQERVATEKSGMLFKSIFMSAYETEKSPPFHHELMGLALREPPYDKEWQGRDGLIIAAPRGSAKSTVLSLAVPMLWGLHRKKKFGILISDTDSQVQFLCDALRREFEDNEKIAEVFGNVRGDRFKQSPLRWTNADFSIALSDPPGSDDPNDIVWTCRYVGRGMRSKVRGLRSRAQRPDFLILDDAENDLHVMTEEQRAKTADWFYKALLPMLDPKTATVIVGGTLIHFDSLLAKLLKVTRADDTPVYVTRLWKAINEDGSSIWPERFTKEWLDNKRATMTARSFNSEFLNDPTDPETQKFRPEWMRWYVAGVDTDVRDGVLYFKDKPLRIYMGVDQAIEEKEDAAIDETAIVVIGVTKDEDIVILHTWHARVDFPTQVRMVRTTATQFNVHLTGIEKAAYQLALRQQIMHEGWLPVHSLNNTRPKYERITAASIPFEQGHVYLRSCAEGENGQKDELGLVKIHPSQQALYTDLVRFPASAHDDLPDAMTNAFIIAGRTRAFEQTA
jgi:predicted phage terminase large subunit-like protein